MKLHSLMQTPHNVASVIVDNRVILSKAAVIIASVIAIYYHDLNLIFGNALQFTTGNISNYVITIPFLSSYIIYRKRNILRAVASLGRENNFNRVRLDDVIGVTLCAVAVLVYLAGSATLYAIEYHMLSIPIFLAGSTMLIFNIPTFRHAIVAILLTLYLQPPPGQLVSELAADLSWTSAVLVEGLLGSIGLPISLDSSLGAPALVIDSGETVTPFFVGEPSSGVFSTIGLSLFAIFVAYIIKGPTWKRLVLFVSGFPLFYLLNTLRIAIVISLWYLWGEDVSETYHVISGSSMVAIGTIMILVLGEKTLKLTFRSSTIRRTKCNICNKCLMRGEAMCLSCGTIIGKIRQIFGKSVERMAFVMFIALIASSLIVTSIQAKDDSRKLSDLNIREIDGPETIGYLLPEISGWDLQYAYRDSRVESVLNQDAALAYRYVLSVPDGTTAAAGVIADTPSIFSSVQISTGHHVWEDSLVTAPSRFGGRPSATLLESEDISISDGKKGRYLLFQRVGSTSTEAVIYWFERTPLKFGLNFENRNVLISLWANTDSLARTGVIGSPIDSIKIKELYLSLALPISQYWDEQSEKLSSSYEVLFTFVHGNFPGLIIVLSVPIALFFVYYQAKMMSMSVRMSNIYRQLNADDRYFIDVLMRSLDDSNHNTGDSIAKRYANVSHKALEGDQLTSMLRMAARSGFVTSGITSVNDESLLVWKINFRIKRRGNLRHYIARMREPWQAIKLRLSRNDGSGDRNGLGFGSGDEL
jgi:exosortase/archaeosortase family protein